MSDTPEPRPATHAEKKRAEQDTFWQQDSLFSVTAGYYPEATEPTDENCPACTHPEENARLVTDGAGLFVCRHCGFDSTEDTLDDGETDNNPF